MSDYNNKSLSNQTNKIFFGGTALISAVASCVELSTASSSTRLLHASKFSPELKQMGLVNIAILVGISVVFYFICRLIVQIRAEESPAEFVLPDIQPELVVDIALKTSFLAVLISGNLPGYTSGVLLMIIGDFLVKGYFRATPRAIALMLGAASFCSGFLFAASGISALAIPLVALSAIAALDVYFYQVSK